MRGADPPLLRGQSSIIPRLSAIVTAWVRSLAPSLERIFFTCPLTVFRYRKVARNQVVGLTGANELQHF
jgi:hypothetical protein